MGNKGNQSSSLRVVKPAGLKALSIVRKIGYMDLIPRSSLTLTIQKAPKLTPCHVPERSLSELLGILALTVKSECESPGLGAWEHLMLVG